MKAKLISYSLISALCLSGAAAFADEAQSKRVSELEAKLETAEKSGKTDSFLLLSLARAYFVSGQFVKGRDAYSKLISVYEKDKATYGDYYVPNTLAVWANDENTYARDFSAAERLMKKQVALVDKLPENNRIRITAHRNLVEFYRSCGKQSQVKQETDVLAKLLGTNDPEKLFPVFNCPACGRG